MHVVKLDNPTSNERNERMVLVAAVSLWLNSGAAGRSLHLGTAGHYLTSWGTHFDIRYSRTPSDVYT